MLEVFKMHSDVCVNHVEGKILGFKLIGENLEYLVGYWVNDDYKQIWFDSFIVKKEKGDKVTIGFKG